MRFILSMVAVLVLVAGTALGAATTRIDPYTFPVFDSCNNETVTVTGEFQSVFTTKDNKDGTVTETFLIHAKGTGVGEDSGALYQHIGTVKQVVISSGSTFSGDITRTIRLISRGSRPNLIADITVNIDSSGNVTVVRVDNCRGAGT